MGSRTTLGADSRASEAAGLGFTSDPNPNPVNFGMLAGFTFWPSVALIAVAHIGFDRALGYGLKYSSAFTHTHLGRIGAPRRQGGLGDLRAGAHPPVDDMVVPRGLPQFLGHGTPEAPVQRADGS